MSLLNQQRGSCPVQHGLWECGWGMEKGRDGSPASNAARRPRSRAGNSSPSVLVQPLTADVLKCWAQRS